MTEIHVPLIINFILVVLYFLVTFNCYIQIYPLSTMAHYHLYNGRSYMLLGQSSCYNLDMISGQGNSRYYGRSGSGYDLVQAKQTCSLLVASIQCRRCALRFIN